MWSDTTQTFIIQLGFMQADELINREEACLTFLTSQLLNCLIWLIQPALDLSHSTESLSSSHDPRGTTGLPLIHTGKVLNLMLHYYYEKQLDPAGIALVS